MVEEARRIPRAIAEEPQSKPSDVCSQAASSADHSSSCAALYSNE
jgi:hypothetical protein